MKILFKNALALHGKGIYTENTYVAVENDKITYVGQELPEGKFDREVNCTNKLLSMAFYNIHAHSAMTLFRGLGEDLPLQRWLEEKIYPAEDRLTDESVRIGSYIAICEMIRSGTVSFTDMYFFCNETCKAVIDSGMKANISRCLVSFDPNLSAKNDERFIEAVKLKNDYHNAADGRIKIDMAIHAEYTNQEKYCREVAEYANENDLNMHIHVSETESEHKECKLRHNGKTPVEFLDSTGLLTPGKTSAATLAHCVWLEDGDMEIIKANKASIAHNPVSNLKLGSGVAPIQKYLDYGINVGFGTDGAASNNALSMIRELQTAAILHKGVNRKPDIIKTSVFHDMATRAGAVAQGRFDCGELKAGNKADIILIDLDEFNNIPVYDPYNALAFSVYSKDVCFTMCDGKILYENGEFKTIDAEKLKAEARPVLAHYFD